MSSIELISSTKSTSRRITAEEYFATYPETNLPMELLEGEVIAMPVPNDDHQHISSALHLALGMEIIPNKLGELRHAPTDVLFDAENVVQPDLFFVAKDNPKCFREENKRWVGPPDLCVEILSPSTAKHDLETKFDLYNKYGVKEYWIVSPGQRYIQVYCLIEGQLERYAVYGQEDTMRSPLLPTVTFKIADIFF